METTHIYLRSASLTQAIRALPRRIKYFSPFSSSLSLSVRRRHRSSHLADLAAPCSPRRDTRIEFVKDLSLSLSFLVFSRFASRGSSYAVCILIYVYIYIYIYIRRIRQLSRKRGRDKEPNRLKVPYNFGVSTARAAEREAYKKAVCATSVARVVTFRNSFIFLLALYPSIRVWIEKFLFSNPQK